MTAALLFLDVDGPLIPFGPKPSGCRRRFVDAPATGNPLLSRLDPRDGQRLLALGCDLVWATSWMDEANDEIGPRLRLPRLPVVTWPGDDVPGAGIHWKTEGLVAWAGGRTFVWVDDEITGADRAWVAAHHPGDALLHRVEAGCGLTAQDFSAIGAWLDNGHRLTGRR